MFATRRRALIPSLAILITPAILLAADRAALTVTGTTQLSYDFGGKTMPWWSGGALLALDGPRVGSQPYIRAFDKDGNAIFSAAFQLADGSVNSISSLARGSDGIVVVAGSAFFKDNDRWAGHFIAWIAPDGKEQHVFRTSFMPEEMTVASDGTIWAQAWSDLSDTNPDRGVIRRFDRSGKLLGAFVPKSSLTKYRKDDDIIYPGHFVTSRDRIGWYSLDHGEYIEFSLDGSEIRRYPTADLRVSFAGLGLCDDGGLFVSGAREVLTLDRANKTWKAVDIGEKSSTILGCEGSALVTTRRADGYALGGSTR